MVAAKRGSIGRDETVKWSLRNDQLVVKKRSIGSHETVKMVVTKWSNGSYDPMIDTKELKGAM